MTMKGTAKIDSKPDTLRRLDNRIFNSQFDFIGAEMNATGRGQGEILRELIAIGITHYTRA